MIENLIIFYIDLAITSLIGVKLKLKFLVRFIHLELSIDRTNNYLDTTRLEELYPTVKNIKVSVRECLEKMKENK